MKLENVEHLVLIESLKYPLSGLARPLVCISSLIYNVKDLVLLNICHGTLHHALTSKLLENNKKG